MWFDCSFHFWAWWCQESSSLPTLWWCSQGWFLSWLLLLIVVCWPSTSNEHHTSYIDISYGSRFWVWLKAFFHMLHHYLHPLDITVILTTTIMNWSQVVWFSDLLRLFWFWVLFLWRAEATRWCKTKRGHQCPSSWRSLYCKVTGEISPLSNILQVQLIHQFIWVSFRGLSWRCPVNTFQYIGLFCLCFPFEVSGILIMNWTCTIGITSI